MLGAIAALVGGVTYAQFSAGPVSLTGETLASATTGLQVSSDGTTFGSTEAGNFSFSGMVPGGTASPDETFYLRNTGTTDLDVSALVGSNPTFTVLPNGEVNTDDVTTAISCSSGAGSSLASPPDGNTLTALEGSDGLLLTGSLKAGDTAKCSVNFAMLSGVVTGSFSGITSNGFSLEFAGNAVPST
jgi:hypothetical protein